MAVIGTHCFAIPDVRPSRGALRRPEEGQCGEAGIPGVHCAPHARAPRPGVRGEAEPGAFTTVFPCSAAVAVNDPQAVSQAVRSWGDHA